MGERGFAVMIVLLAVVSVGILKTGAMPPGWPWRGISIESLDFDPQRFGSIAEYIPINSVQLRLKPSKLARTENIPPHAAWKQALEWGDQMLDQCARVGIVAIMTVEGFPLDPKVSYDQKAMEFWDSDSDLREVVSLADKLSAHFSGRGKELAAYQLLSEPVIVVRQLAVKPPNWRALADKIVKVIRQNDPERWVAVAPPPWGKPDSYRDFVPLEFERIIYGAHMYVPHAFTHQGIRQWKTLYTYPGEIGERQWDRESLKVAMEPLRDFQKEYEVPVWIGEFSAIRWANGGEEYLKDLVAIFTEFGWSWTYFSLNGWHGWMPDYSKEYGMSSNLKEGRDKVASQKIGLDSVRWTTLRDIYRMVQR